MLKATDPAATVQKAADALRKLLAEVPALGQAVVRRQRRASDAGVDVTAQIELPAGRRTLACRVEASGQPRRVRPALQLLREYAAGQAAPVTPLLAAPYLSLEARGLCKEAGVGYIDFAGNARLVFDGIFIDRQVASTKPAPERREAALPLFNIRSAQVLRLMLRDPQRLWRTGELSETAGVSQKQVSNVRSVLLEKQWAKLTGDGVQLTEPEALLDAWREAYEPPAGQRHSFYTTLHGTALDSGLRSLGNAPPDAGQVALASFSAAQWLAPYGRSGTHYFYADPPGLERLRFTLKLFSASIGENVVVTVVDEPGLFRDTVKPAPSIACTSPVQTYLDLFGAGERGREAAQQLRLAGLGWAD